MQFSKLLESSKIFFSSLWSFIPMEKGRKVFVYQHSSVFGAVLYGTLQNDNLAQQEKEYEREKEKEKDEI